MKSIIPTIAQCLALAPILPKDWETVFVYYRDAPKSILDTAKPEHGFEPEFRRNVGPGYQVIAAPTLEELMRIIPSEIEGCEILLGGDGVVSYANKEKVPYANKERFEICEGGTNNWLYNLVKMIAENKELQELIK